MRVKVRVRVRVRVKVRVRVSVSVRVEVWDRVKRFRAFTSISEGCCEITIAGCWW